MDVTPQEIERRIAALVEACRRERVKATYQRIEIFREVPGTIDHPDAETIYERVRTRIPAIALDTVYRTLALLERLGLISKVQIHFDRSRFHANTAHHHHYVCFNCGLLRDFSITGMDAIDIPEEVRSWGKVESIPVTVQGLCSKCTRSDEKGRVRPGTGQGLPF